VATVVVIGAGLAGLTAAYRLGAQHEVLVLEAGNRLGGQIHTELDRGFVVERGGEGFVARSAAVPALAGDLGMPRTELIGQAQLRSYGYDGAELRELRPGEAATLLGFQVPQEELGKGIRSLRRGMGSLIWALAGNLGPRAAISLETPVAALETRGAELTVVAANGRTLPADGVVVATSAAAAAVLLDPIAGESARALAGAKVVSSVTVELAYPRDAIAHALDGSGFVVALSAQQQGLRACTFTSAKFIDRAPPDTASLRLFFRPDAGELAALADDAWIARARAGLARVIAVRGEPLRAWVSRWPDALPVFDDAHRGAVAALERALAPRPIALAGSALHGSGIDAAVRSAEQAAETLAAALALR
jgi:protoporphyrinogen/coproporphyrinogen III oxidase